MQQLLITIVVSAALLGVDGCSSRASCNDHGTLTGGSNNVNCTCRCQEGWADNPNCLYYTGPCSEYSLSSCSVNQHSQCVWTNTVCQLRALENCQSIKTAEVCDDENTNTCEWSREWQECNLLPNQNTHMPHHTPGPTTPNTTAPTEVPPKRSDSTKLLAVLLTLGALIVLAPIFLYLFYSRKMKQGGRDERSRQDLVELTMEEITTHGVHHEHNDHHVNHERHVIFMNPASPPPQSDESFIKHLPPPPPPRSEKELEDSLLAFMWRSHMPPPLPPQSEKELEDSLTATDSLTAFINRMPFPEKAPPKEDNDLSETFLFSVL